MKGSDPQGATMKTTAWKALVPVVVAIGIALIPVPQGLTPNAWYFFAVFTAVIVGLIVEPIPAAAVGLIGVSLVATLGLVSPKPGDSIKWALSGFSNTTVWLIFGAFMLSMGYEKTGLGRRIALSLVKALGRKTLGLGYAVTISDVILGPFTPSNTARSGGTIFPVIRNIPVLYDSLPGETARKIGSYVLWTAFAATCVTSSFFLTGLAPNLLALALVKETVNMTFTWSEWFYGFFPVGVPLLIILPYLIYKIYPPEIKHSEEVPLWAAEELGKMGRLTLNEVIMALLAILALVLWIAGGKIVDATTVTLIVISLMLITGIVSHDDILSHKKAWDILVWFATLVALADGLNKVGFVAWFAKGATAVLAGMSPIVTLVVLVSVFYIVHYMFASLTAHTTALLPVMLAAGAAVPDMPVKVFALLLCYSLGLMGILTPYATGPGPVYFGSGYISRKDFWTQGFILGIIFLAFLLGIGMPWLLATTR
jgi:L-tartrate/succinate antiporter